MKKLTILFTIILTSCQLQKFDKIVFKDRHKLKAIVTRQSLDDDFIQYHLPTDTTTQEVKTEKLKKIKFNKQKFSDGYPVFTVKYHGTSIIYVSLK